MLSKVSTPVTWREEVARTKEKLIWTGNTGENRFRVLAIIKQRSWWLDLHPEHMDQIRTGRMFTGDASGDILFRNLYMYGFANQPRSIQIERWTYALHHIFISAVCRCVPPGNKPDPHRNLQLSPIPFQGKSNCLDEYPGVGCAG